jgi:hypothetical protein
MRCSSLHDVAYYSATFLLAAVNHQVYSPPSVANSNGGDGATEESLQTNSVMNYIYNYSSAEFAQVTSSSSELISALCAQCVRSWLERGCDTEELDVPTDSLVMTVRSSRKRQYLRRYNISSRSSPNKHNSKNAGKQTPSMIDNDDDESRWFIGKFAGALKNWLLSKIWSGDETELTVHTHLTHPQHLGSAQSSQLTRSGSTNSMASSSTQDDSESAHSSSYHYASYQSTPLSTPRLSARGVQHFDFSGVPGLVSSTYRFKNVADASSFESHSPLADKCRALLLLFIHNRR